MAGVGANTGPKTAPKHEVPDQHCDTVEQLDALPVVSGRSPQRLWRGGSAMVGSASTSLPTSTASVRRLDKRRNLVRV